MDEDTTREGVTDEQDDATQPDSEQPQALPPDSPAARRLAAMDSIRMARVAQLETEIGTPVVIDDAPASDTPTDAKDQPHAQEVAAQLADDDGFISPDMLSRKVRLKIDGEEVAVPLEQLVRTAQKESAADRRLREATELLRQAQAREQQAATPEKTTGTVSTSAEPGPSPDETVRAKLKDALGAIFSGDEDAAADAFAQVLASRQPQQAPQVDPDALAEVVTQRLDERSALDRFLGTYQRIASNPWLQQAADAEFERLRAEGKPFQEALDGAGRAVYQQFGYEIPQANPGTKPPATTRQDTLRARKADLDIPVGRSVSAAQTRVAPESSEAERSMTIADMAAARRGERQQARR